MNRDEDTHKIYGYVTEEEFYNGLNEAKKENIYVDEKGWVDIGALLAGMWKAFGEGRMVVIPREGFKRPEKKITEDVQKQVDAMPLVEVGGKDEMPEINKDGMAIINIETPKKRPSRAKAKKEITEPAAE